MRISIIDSKPEIRWEDVKPGQIFRWLDNIYLKIVKPIDSDVNAILLSSETGRRELYRCFYCGDNPPVAILGTLNVEP